LALIGFIKHSCLCSTAGIYMASDHLYGPNFQKQVGAQPATGGLAG